MTHMVFDVTIRVQVDIDADKLAPLMAEFNSHISNFGEGESAVFRHGAHIARLAATGTVDFWPDEFVEGYGPVGEAGISVKIIEGGTLIDRILPQEVA